MTMKDDAPLRSLRRSDRYALAVGETLVVGAVQHPATLLWQAWLSLDGLSLINVSAHRSRRAAEEIVLVLDETYRTQNLLDANSAEALIDGLNAQGDEQPTPLPPEICREIGELIVRERGVGQQG